MDDTLILLQGKGTDLKYTFTNPIYKKGAAMRLAFYTLSTYYSWPNITAKNNTLVYSDKTLVGPDGAPIKKTIILPKGAYDFNDIASYISKNLKNNLHDNAFTLTANTNTLHSIITINDDKYTIHLGDSSIKSVLGFTSNTDLAKGTHNSDTVVNITPINRILINCDIVDGAYQPYESKLVQHRVIGSFYPAVEPGYKINIEKNMLFYNKVLAEKIDTIRVWLSDQDGNPIDNGDEYLGVELHLKF